MEKIVYIPQIMEAINSKVEALRNELTAMRDHYERHAEWNRKRAERATQGSSIQQEILRGEAYNRGRANAIKEVLELLGFDDNQEITEEEKQ